MPLAFPWDQRLMSIDIPKKHALLPPGFTDVLTPDAAHEYQVVSKINHVFRSYGYEQIRLPMVENESAQSYWGPGHVDDMFRFTDPETQKTLTLRRDITPQVWRLAKTRLAADPRPLRVSYHGQVLTAARDQITPERELTQIGVEMMGAGSLAADLEILQLSMQAFQAIGLHDISVDLCWPSVLTLIGEALGLSDDDRNRAEALMSLRDRQYLDAMPEKAAEVCALLIDLAGPAGRVLPELDRLKTLIPQVLDGPLDRLRALVTEIRANVPGIQITIDLWDAVGFNYYSGIAFTFYKKGARRPLGRGGRYVLAGENAAGVSLFVEEMVKAGAAYTPPKRIFLPGGVGYDTARTLREQGWVAVSCLDGAERSSEDRYADAKSHHCAFIWLNGRAEPVP